MMRCGRGDQAAFQALYERHHRMIYNLAFRMLGNHADAEEVTPDVFVKVWQKAAEFRGHSRVSTWIYRIAANMAMDRLRSARVGREIFWDDLTPVEKEMPDRDAAETPEEAVLRQEDQRALATAMARLAAEDRLLVTLYHLQGCTYAEIEEITGISPVNIKSKLFRARRCLRENMLTNRKDPNRSLEKGDAPDDVQGRPDAPDGLRMAAAIGH
jgi:RNA polymerase sigma-70 factor (ECF subfamily)